MFVGLMGRFKCILGRVHLYDSLKTLKSDFRLDEVSTVSKAS
jgi:hypothetical protein